MLATTATANSRVVDDVAEVLGLGRDERRRAGAARRPRPRVAASGRAAPAVDRAPPGLAGRAPRRAARLGHHLHADRRRAPRRSPTTCASAASPSPPTPGQTEQTERLAAEDDLINNRVKALVATSALGHGLRQARPGLRHPLRRAVLADRLLPAGRPRRARRRRGRGDPAARRGGRGDLGLLRLGRLPAPRSRCATALAALDASRRPISTAALETQVDLSRSRLETMLKVLDVDGAVHRVARRLGRDRPAVGLRRRALRAGGAGAPRRAAGDARLHRHRPAAACGSCASSSTTPTPTDCGRCDNCGGLDLPTATVERRPCRPRPSACCDRPGVTARAAPAVAHRDASARRRRPRQDRRRRAGRDRAARSPASPISASAQRVRAAARRRRADAPVPDELIAAAVKVLAAWDWDAAAGRGRRRRLAHAARCWSPTWPPGWRDRPAAVSRRASRTPARPARGRSNSAQRLRDVWGSLRGAGRAAWLALERPAESCWSTTSPTPAGRSPSSPACCAQPAPARSIRSCWARPADRRSRGSIAEHRAQPGDAAGERVLRRGGVADDERRTMVRGAVCCRRRVLRLPDRAALPWPRSRPRAGPRRQFDEHVQARRDAGDPRRRGARRRSAETSRSRRRR